MTVTAPVARGPLTEVHEAAQATMAVVDGWLVAMRYPREPPAGGNALVDVSHWGTGEINGRDTGAILTSLVGTDVPLRTIHRRDHDHVYRLTERRAILFTPARIPADKSLMSLPEVLDVTGGWASVVLIGPDAQHVLSKVTALDLRPSAIPIGACCQGPIFGMNVLFGRFCDGWELHVCTDSAEFLFEVLLDAGHEFDLRAAGLEFYHH